MDEWFAATGSAMSCWVLWVSSLTLLLTARVQQVVHLTSVMLSRDGGNNPLHPPPQAPSCWIQKQQWAVPEDSVFSFVSYWNWHLRTVHYARTHVFQQITSDGQHTNLSALYNLLLQILIVAECRGGGTSHISNPTAPYAPHGCILSQRCLILLLGGEGQSVSEMVTVKNLPLRSLK